MNNLIIAILLFGAAAISWFHQFAKTRSAKNDARSLAARVQSIEQSLVAEHASAAALESQLISQRETAREAHRALERASAEARELITPADISTDGAWPAAHDYFYLPKQFLGTLGYIIFRNDGRLSDEAAALFGLTPAEKASLTDWFRDLRLEHDQLQLEHAKRMEPARPDSANHREISFRLPALTNEAATLRHRFEQDLRGRLGNTRGPLIWEKVSQQAPLDGYPMGHEEQVVTYTADRNPDGTVQHRLSFKKPDSTYSFPIQFDAAADQGMINDEDDGSRTASLGVKLPLSPESALWNYRHLFGDQPLLR